MYQCPLCHRLDCKAPLCPSCLVFIRQLMRTDAYCLRCGNKKISSHNTVCSACAMIESPINYFWTSFDYRAPLSKLIQIWKFHHRITYSRALSYLMLMNPPPWLKKHKIETAIAMPLTVKSYQQRLFNQSQELAKKISQRYQIPLYPSHLLVKNNQEAQHKLSQKERFINMKHAFHIVKAPSCKNILLIDDVATTMATLNELAHTLRKKFNYQLFAWTLAKKS